MKNIYKQISQAFIAMGILLVTTTSCGSDDKNDTTNEILQGLWRLTKTENVSLINNPSESAEGETPEATDTSISYPDNEGVQPYLRFNASTYDYFEVTTADTTTRETGAYTLAKNEITTLNSSEPAKTYGYTISGKQLIMIEKKDDAEITYFAEKVVGDPFLTEEPTDNEDPDNPNDEAPTGCAVYHDTNATPGSSLNPNRITTGAVIEGTLYNVEGRNGYEARYYLEVAPYTAYRVKIRDIITAYENVISQFKYTTITATYAFSTDKPNYKTDIKVVGESLENETLLTFDLFPTSNCLYIEFFSYEKEVAFKFEVESLSGTEE